jgi:two-component system response regulator HydG
MSTHTRVLIVNADGGAATALLHLLGPAGYQASLATDLEQAEGMLERADADVVLLSLDVAGLAGVTRLAAAAPEAELVMLADAGQAEMAREGLRLGACDVVARTGDLDAFLFALERAAREGRMRRELAILRTRVHANAEHELVGRSPSMTLVRELIGRAAASRVTVLVTGEPGTGKDVVARLVHELSDRAGRPFIVVRCEGADGQTLEEELFGGTRGGLLETVRGGTLVLDEVGSLPREVRARLAVAMAERVVRRAGAPTALPIDVRLVLTARTDAGEPSLAGSELLPFGERNVLPIALPPLRDRRSDIPLLVQHFRTRAARAVGTALPPLAAGMLNTLMGHHWPGNVRELEHWMERIAYATSTDESESGALAGPGSEFAQLDTARLTLERLERRYILHVLEQERGHQSRAADRLGIDRRTLYRKLKEYRDDGVRVQQAG